MTDYSKTISLPATKFSMKANLSQTEVRWMDFWKEKKIIDRKKKLQKKHPNLFFTTAHPMRMVIFT